MIVIKHKNEIVTIAPRLVTRVCAKNYDNLVAYYVHEIARIKCLLEQSAAQPAPAGDDLRTRMTGVARKRRDEVSRSRLRNLYINFNQLKQRGNRG